MAMARAPQHNGNVITSNTTISVALLVTIIVGAVNAGILWARVEGAVNTQRNDKVALQTSQDRAEALLQELVRADVFAEKLALINVKLAEIDKRVELALAEQKHLRTDAVSRAEFDLRRGAADALLKEVKDQVVTIQQTFNESFPRGRTWEELFARLKRLEDIRINHIPALPPKNSEVGNGPPAG